MQLTRDSIITKQQRSFVLLLCTAVLLSLGITTLLSVSPLPIVATDASWSGPDFSYCAIFFKGWWDGTISNPFSYNEQIHQFQRVYGYRGDVIMPVAWSPWSGVLLYPFLRLSTDASAALAWVIVSFGIFIGSIVTWTRLANNSLLELLFRTSVGVAIIVSVASIQTMGLAQLSFLGAGCISFILMLSNFHARAQMPIAALCVSALSIKPTYALLALSILIVERRWRPLFASAGCVAILAIIAAAMFPVEAWSDWLYQLRLHSNPTDQRYLSAGTVRGYLQSAVIGNALAVWLPDTLVHQVSVVLFAVILATILMLGVFRSQISRALLCFLLNASFLLTLPYIGAHDELLVFPLLVSACAGAKRVHGASGVVILSTLLVLLFYPLSPMLRLAFKAMLATGLFFSLIRRDVKT